MALEEETSGQANMTSVPPRRSARIRRRRDGQQFHNCDNENAPTTSRKKNCPIPEIDDIEQPPSKKCIGPEYQAELPDIRPKSLAAFDHDEAELVSKPLEQEGVGKGSDEWSMKEKIAFSRGMFRFGKDFWKIHRMVHTKTTAQCITFYYDNKKHAKISQKKNLIFRDNESQTPAENRASTSRKRKTQRREGQEEMAKKRRK